MGLIYGLFTMIDLGLFDTIGPWFSFYTRTKHNFARYLLPQLLLSAIPLLLSYSIMLIIYPLPYSPLLILIALTEQTKRHLRLLLNLAGSARYVALVEGISYILYVIIVWFWYYFTNTISLPLIFITVSLTSTMSVLLLAYRTHHFYIQLPQAPTIPAPWRTIISQRVACTLTNLATIHGLHTLLMPLIATHYQQGALLTCLHTIIAALATIASKLITIAATLSFMQSPIRLRLSGPAEPAGSDAQADQGDTRDNNHVSLPVLVRTVTFAWLLMLSSTMLISNYLYPTLTSYLLITICLYAIPSLQQIPKIALDTRFQSGHYSLIATISCLITHALFYAILGNYIATPLAITLILISIMSSFSITYWYAQRALTFTPAIRTSIPDQIPPDQPPLDTTWRSTPTRRS